MARSKENRSKDDLDRPIDPGHRFIHIDVTRIGQPPTHTVAAVARHPVPLALNRSSAFVYGSGVNPRSVGSTGPCGPMPCELNTRDTRARA